MGSARADLLSSLIRWTTLLQHPVWTHEIPESSLLAILHAVGDQHIPKELDRAALRLDLFRVYAAYYFALDAKPPTLRAAQQAVGRFSAALKRFHLALQELKEERSPVLHIL